MESKCGENGSTRATKSHTGKTVNYEMGKDYPESSSQQRRIAIKSQSNSSGIFSLQCQEEEIKKGKSQEVEGGSQSKNESNKTGKVHQETAKHPRGDVPALNHRGGVKIHRGRSGETIQKQQTDKGSTKKFHRKVLPPVGDNGEGDGIDVIRSSNTAPGNHNI